MRRKIEDKAIVVDQYISKNKVLRKISDAERAMLPAIVDMNMVHMAPIYYTYCLRRNIINLDDAVKSLDRVFNCLICGERGTTRTSAASLLYYLLNNRKRIRAFRINCAGLDENVFALAFRSASSPLREKDRFLLFYELNYLPYRLQIELGEYLQAHGHKCVATICENPRDGKEWKLYPNLREQFGGATFHTTPLRESREDIRFICETLLSFYNVEYRKHVLGFTQEAMDVLIQYDWPDNITHASQVIGNMVSEIDEAYITLETLKKYLNDEHTERIRHTFTMHFDNAMSLDDMTRAIVNDVLQQENWNQSRTARRLGISRSTLWRMLK